MDKLKISYLITLEAMGCISTKDYSELLKAMQSEKNFPWKEMGEYQNLAALLSLVVNQELPAKKLKDEILNEIEKNEKRKPEVEIKSDLSKKQKSILAAGKETQIELNNIPDEKLEQNNIKKEELKIVDHSSEFEEVKAKLFKIKDHQKKTPEPGLQLIDKDIQEIQFVKSEKHKKSAYKFFNKRSVIIASIAFVVIVFPTIFFLNFFDDGIDEQKKVAAKETEMLISKSRIIPKEQDPVVTAENIEQVEPQNNKPEQFQLKKEEISQLDIPPVLIEQKKEKESQNPVLPPPQTPDFIDAPLIIEENKDNSEKVTNHLTTIIPDKQLPPKEEIVVNEEPVYFVAVEEMPEPIGGISGIQKKIVYPELAKRAGIEGKVLVLAFVDESGNVTKAEVIKGIGLGCDEAAINAIVQTKFKPGMQRGKPVKVQVTIPVTFKL